MHAKIIVATAIFGVVSSSLYFPSSWNDVTTNLAPSCELGDQLRYLPMFIIPSKEISVLQDYRTQFYTPAPALINFVGQKQTIPAVRVVLNNPIPVTSWKSFIEFPTSFTIFQDGYRLPFEVSALYAPIPNYSLRYPPAISVVYAVPTVRPQRPINPQYVSYQTPIRNVPPQNVTILHFPEAIAEPEVVYHLEEDDDELGGRNPPQPVIPAGIVQSTAPILDVTTFVNSKESPVLHALRDEAMRLKNALRTQKK